MQIYPPALELVSRPGEIESKHPAAELVGEPGQFVLCGLETAQPVLQRQEVMLAQTLDVADFKPRGFRRAQSLADAGEKMIWKNIAVVKRTAGPRRRARRMADRMMEKLAARTQRGEG